MAVTAHDCKKCFILAIDCQKIVQSQPQKLNFTAMGTENSPPSACSKPHRGQLEQMPSFQQSKTHFICSAISRESPVIC